jgi:hypothetical protein
METVFSLKTINLSNKTSNGLEISSVEIGIQGLGKLNACGCYMSKTRKSLENQKYKIFFLISGKTYY